VTLKINKSRSRFKNVGGRKLDIQFSFLTIICIPKSLDSNNIGAYQKFNLLILIKIGWKFQPKSIPPESPTLLAPTTPPTLLQHLVFVHPFASMLFHPFSQFHQIKEAN
jgi:hypothetical protein